MFPNDYLDMSKRLRLFDVEVPIFRLLHLNTPTNHPKENILIPPRAGIIMYIYKYIVILSCDSVLTLSGRGEPPHKGQRMSRDYVLHVPVHSQHLCGVAFDMVSFLHSRGPSHEMAACT
jgi:hypothetical protein